jgi:hypothetical protein
VRGDFITARIKKGGERGKMSQEKDKKMRREGAKCHKKRFYVV